MSEISTDRNELITRFMEVCAVDRDIAERVLIHNDWNIETAVQDYFQSSTSAGGWEETQNTMNHEQELRYRRRSLLNSTETPESISSDASSSSDMSFRRKSPPPLSWSEWTLSLLRLPLDFIYHSFLDILRFFLSLLKSPVLAVADPRGDVQGFIEDFNERFPNSRNKLNWRNLSYNEVLDECKRNLRFLLVYLHNPSHQDCDSFVNEKLLSNRMLQFIERNQLVLWGASVHTQEGYKVSMALRENTYPFLGLICMRSNRMVMVLRIEGDYELNPMLFAIQSAINENQVHLNAVRTEREQREADSRIRREQEADYERGLAADRAKMDEKRKLESARKKALEKAQQEKRELERKLARFAEMKRNLRDTLPPETKDSESVRMNIRFPCGAHFERRFSLDESLERLFVATFVHEKCPMNFSMYTSYPRKQLHCAPEWYREFGTVLNDPKNIPTFREAAFESSATILIQDNDA